MVLAMTLNSDAQIRLFLCLNADKPAAEVFAEVRSRKNRF